MSLDYGVLTRCELRQLPTQLIKAGLPNRASRLLTEPAFLEVKAHAGMIFGLGTDLYETARALDAGNPGRVVVERLAEAVRGNLHFLARHPGLLFQCLWNSCSWSDQLVAKQHHENTPQDRSASDPLLDVTDGSSMLRAWLEDWRTMNYVAQAGRNWLRALRPSLVGTSGSGRMVLSGHELSVECVRFIDADRQIVSVALDDSVRRWCARSGEQLDCREMEFGYGPLALSKDGTLVAAASGTAIILWDVLQCTIVARLEGHADVINQMCFSPGAEYIASVSDDATVRVWDVQAKEEIQRLPGYNHEVICAAWNSDGYHVAAGGVDGAIRIWRVPTWEQTTCISDSDVPVDAIAFLPGSRWIAVARFDATICVVDIVSGSEVQCPRAHSFVINDLACAPSGEMLASASADGTVRTWEPTTGRQTACLRAPTANVASESVAISDDGQWIASGSDDGVVCVWPKAHVPDPSVRRVDASRVFSVCFVDDGRYLVSCASDDLAIWDAVTGEQVSSLEHKGLFARPIPVAGTNRFVTASMDGTIRIWDCSERRTLLCLEGHDGCVNSLTTDTTGRLLLSASDDRTARMWDLRYGTERQRFVEREQVLCAAVSFDGRYVVTAAAGHAPGIWDAQGGRKLRSLDSPDGVSAITDLIAFLPDGDRVALVWGQSVYLARASTGRLLGEYRGHTDSITSLAVSDDGRAIAAYAEDGLALVWDIESFGTSEVLHGCYDLGALVNDSQVFPWRAVGRGLETVIESTASGEEVAWFPSGDVEKVDTHSSGTLWAVIAGGSLLLLSLETDRR